MSEIPAQFGRVKGAQWFPLLHQRNVMVLGQGGIGSWVSLLLARTGANLHLFDMDVYEEHNMTGQLVERSSIGMNKAEAMKSLLQKMSPDTTVRTYGEYTLTSPTNDIVICGLDNMFARKIAFEKWEKMMHTLEPEKRKNCFFQDGRLLAEQLQVFSIPGDRTELQLKYKTEHLPKDEDVQEAECTFKQTSHCAAMIASHMVGFLTNWIANANLEPAFRQVPFFYEYLIPINYTKNANP